MNILCPPIAFFGTAAPTVGIISAFEAAFTMGDSDFTVTIGGVQSNDVILALQVANLTTNDIPVGYSFIASGLLTTPTTRINASYKFASGVEASVTFPHGNFFTPQDGVACAVYIIRGVNTINSLEAFAVKEQQSFSVNGQPKSNFIFTVTANALIFSAFGATVGNDDTYLEPTGYLSKVDLFAGIPSVFPRYGLGVAARVRPLAGTEVPPAWSDVTSDLAIDRWAALTIAFRMV